MLSRQNINIKAFYYILPALLAMIFVHVIPIFWGIYISFVKLDLYNLTQFTKAPFIGIANFIEIFSHKSAVGFKFLLSIYNILIYGLITIPVTMIIAYLVAILLNRQILFSSVIKGIILLPYITPDSVWYNVWRFIFQSRVGVVNMLLYKLGLIHEPLIWLVGDNALIAVIIAAIWKSWPYNCILLLSGLQNIPKDLIEAARLDGTNAWQRFWLVIYPMMWPITRTLLLISFIWNFHTFNSFYVMLGGDTTQKAAVPSLVIYNEGFKVLQYGLSSAMAVVLLIIIFIFTFFAIINRKEEIR